MNSGFVTYNRFLAVLNIISSKMYAAKTVSSSFLSFDKYVSESSDQMLWIEVLNSCFAHLMVKLMVGGIVTVVSRIKKRRIKIISSKRTEAKWYSYFILGILKGFDYVYSIENYTVWL